MHNYPLSELQGKILVVDDQVDNHRLLSRILTKQGYDVRKAINGKMALIGVQTDPPDLILLDIRMPHMDGYEVCEQLKASAQTKEIPIIFLSALSEAWDKVQAFRIGGVDYISKPFHPEEVLARVENQLTIRRLQQQLQEKNTGLCPEQDESESLLINTQPEVIAQQFQPDTSLIAEQYEQVTILFADIVNFTSLTDRMSPQALVNLLSQIFSTFDQLTQKHGVEKIKTIGNAYMVVGGLPRLRSDHVEVMADMALELQQAITQFRVNEEKPLIMRIGINTGSVVAGVIDTTKFIYDLWGDAVSVASRMESSGEPGCIQVTAATYDFLKDKYLLEKRGAIMVKGKGEMTTYWLKSKLSGR
ncbi:MAG: response regulator [Symploca sp. SIO2E6]|nr:response regulator [Symploca sp. SIO2E6]